MNKFLFKSTDADLTKIYTTLDTLQKNVLYVTHQVDFIRKIVIRLDLDKGLQKQVTEYYDSDAEILGHTEPPADPHDLD